jgi:predicted metal-dependent phosphoesterase TrpH
MRCDLHVHTRHSGMFGVPLLNRVCRESYNEPCAVYETLKARGMGLVTVTDHDSIDAAEPLRSKPDFFLSEEVTATMPGGTEIHIGVYGIDERQHREMQTRRHDLDSLLAYLNEQRLLFSINHAFSSLTGRRVQGDFNLFADRFPAIETLNGHMLRCANISAAAFAAQWRNIVVGGSDSHTLAPLGRTYTEISGAKNARDFLERMRLGHGRVYGESGSFLKLTRVAGSVGCSMAREIAWTGVLFPLLIAVPLVTFFNYVSEVLFNYRLSRRAERVRATPDLAI